MGAGEAFRLLRDGKSVPYGNGEVETMEQRMCPVDVISVCSADGEIRPLRLQLIDEERQMLRINIEQVISVEDIDHVGMEAKLFRCRATVWGKKWTFDLKYYIRSHNWRVQRMN